MKPIKSLVVLGALGAFPAISALAPDTASAQPAGYYGPGGGPVNSTLPGGFHNRQGRLMFGGAFGLGGMSDDVGDIGCNGCDYNPISFGFMGHIGGFLSPRFALMFEGQVNGQQVSQAAFPEDDAFLYQSAAMVAGQYWITPQLWVKGGIGFAHLEEQSADGFFQSNIDNGTAIMGAIGYEVFSSRLFSVDLEGRLLNGAYKGIDNNITAGTVGVGVNWF